MRFLFLNIQQLKYLLSTVGTFYVNYVSNFKEHVPKIYFNPKYIGKVVPEI